MSNTDIDRAERARALDDFANAAAQRNQPPPAGHALVRPTTGIAERVVGAQPVAVNRKEGEIFEKLRMLGAAAGTDWFYRYPVKKKVKNEKTGQDEWVTDWIEGPSIKLANDVARIFGNNVNEVREIDVGDAWTFYARIHRHRDWLFDGARLPAAQGPSVDQIQGRRPPARYRLSNRAIEGDPKLHRQRAANLCRLRLRRGAQFAGR